MDFNQRQNGLPLGDPRSTESPFSGDPREQNFIVEILRQQLSNPQLQSLLQASNLVPSFQQSVSSMNIQDILATALELQKQGHFINIAEKLTSPTVPASCARMGTL